MEKKRTKWGKKLVVFLTISFIIVSIFIYTNAQNEIDKNALITYGFLKKQVDTLTTYIDTNIKRIESKINSITNKTNELNNRINNIESNLNNLNNIPQVTSTFKSTKGKYELIKVKKGQIIIFDNSTQFILRSGVALSILPPQTALIDVTSAKDIVNGQNIQRNHLIIVVKDDGRGFKANEDVWCYINGGYKLK
ncbi:hypothetical protein ACAG39_03220 [Caldicellulosiruptoraceae bacterium PP1]